MNGTCICGGSGQYAVDYSDGYSETRFCTCDYGRAEAAKYVEAVQKRAWGKLAGEPPPTASPSDFCWKSEAMLLSRYLIGLGQLDYIGQPERALFFHGPTRAGKSTLAGLLLQALIEVQERAGMFVNLPLLVAALRQGIDDGTSDMLRWQLENTPILVLDDLGSEQDTPFVLNALYLIVNARRNPHYTTIITGNYSLDDLFAASKGNPQMERIIGRLSELCMIVEVTRNDWSSKP